ncbi:DUF2913 family protein [Aliivibrio fischeri]|uniref:Uncharacterized protein n=1 Tax=Aliivibrio fischeri TaxID=668 RepID=A0A510UP67_ALIFS|nr:DUF2913 family protein [Aliivibrio fischeri]MUK77494.1 DUF2913 family protein [Aliivibrio fischeri]GEK15040.1 hypothetical protein AFI02nite_30760 [Aliivibrio fischeri]
MSKEKKAVDYYQEIQRVINSALGDLQESKDSGRLPKNPVSANHFLIRWVTTAIKSQRFAHCVAKDLMTWQKEGRTKGTGTQLPVRFEQYSRLYAELAPVEQATSISKSAIMAWSESLEEKEWCVTTEYEVLEKASLFSDGDHSFIICSTQLESCFDAESEELIKPLTCYVRGNHHEFVESAFEHGLMVHKRSDYKSKVKYHGEYLIYPHNHGTQLGEIPFSFNVKK